ncbi:hypothetical protein ACX0G9_04150 [Flavitalea flava]
MKTSLFVYSVVISVASLIGSCRSSRSDQQTTALQTGIWQQQPIFIDGQDGDWTRPLPYTDKKEKLNYSITNDRENIYILLAVKDEIEQQKILQGGMTVWVNGSAEKNESNAVGIGFPTDSRKDHDRRLMEEARGNRGNGNVNGNSNGNGRKDEPKEKFATLEDLKDYSLYGFLPDGNVGNYDYGDHNEAEVGVKIGFNKDGEMIYEASIPLKTVFPKNNATGKSIAVGFVVEGFPPDANVRQRGGGGGGVSIGGGLGMGSFGSGGGVGLSIGTGSLGRIGGGKKDRQLYEQNKIWQVVPVARPSR